VTYDALKKFVLTVQRPCLCLRTGFLSLVLVLQRAPSARSGSDSGLSSPLAWAVRLVIIAQRAAQFDEIFVGQGVVAIIGEADA
jgi:hypothetical protein